MTWLHVLFGLVFVPDDSLVKLDQQLKTTMQLILISSFLSWPSTCWMSRASKIREYRKMEDISSLLWLCFWQIFWRIFLTIILTYVSTNFVINFFDELFLQYFLRIFWRKLFDEFFRRTLLTNFIVKIILTNFLTNFDFSVDFFEPLIF